MVGSPRPSFAEEKSTTTFREEREIGVIFGLGGHPAPSLFSMSIADNLGRHVRVMAGVGTAFVLNTVGLGAQYLFVTEGPFTPMVGLSFSTSQETDLWRDELDSPAESLNYSSSMISAGLDWQFKNGTNVGVGLNVAWWQEPKGALDSPLIPYFSVGYFF